ncbi:MAG TPA: SpoIVB peptidase S55 domain-containing protein [Vicinamibacterales bacterium]|nr:SpoIVB peptidase S55 domain-containing protein [Vicinamibacterales bacterium]
MNFRTLTVLAVVSGLAIASPVAQTSVIPVDEIRPGMVGVGRTVFEGTKIEEFQVHILGVLKNVIGPGRSLVLARLEGGPLAKTGVIAGMSGSPVYVDGRMLGAVSYSLGQFSKEPIAGITPIGEMTDATALAGTAPASRPVAMTFPVAPQDLFAIWSRDLGRTRPFAEDASHAMLSGDASLSPQMATMLQPIAVPLVMSGFAPGVLGPLSATLTDRGFLPMAATNTQSARAASAPAKSRTLHPGDAMGVALLSGDFALGATGTVTHVDGDKVYGFGHPMYNLGPTEFPLTQAEVLVVLPSLMASSKLASFGAVIGTVQQDRATAVAGRIGVMPKMIPVSITLNSDRTPSRTFNFEVVKDHTFTPLLTYLAVANVLTSYERGAGPASYTVRGTASVREHDDIAFEDIFSGDQPAGAASAYVAGPLTFLIKNASQPVEVQKLALTIDASEQSRTARIERVWLDADRPRAGRAAIVKVLLRTNTGEEVVKSVPIQIPLNAGSSVQLLVADAHRMASDDRRHTRGAETQEAAQLIRTFNKARKSNRLYIRLSAPDDGAIVNGEPLTALPPSVLAVFEADRNSGTFSPLRSATRGEWEVPIELSISGSRQLTIALEQP